MLERLEEVIDVRQLSLIGAPLIPLYARVKLVNYCPSSKKGRWKIEIEIPFGNTEPKTVWTWIKELVKKDGVIDE